MEVSFLSQYRWEFAGGNGEYPGEAARRGIEIPSEPTPRELLGTPSAHQVLQKAEDRLEILEWERRLLIN